MGNQNKKALITGAGSGIGLALAKKLLNEGYDVIATSRSGKIEGFEHDNLTVVPLELKDEESVTNLAAQVKDIDLLINNSGIAPDVFAVVPDKNSFNETIAVNLTGTVFFTEAVLLSLKNSGQIFFISSNMGLPKNAAENGPAYRISKAGINMYAAVLSQRLSERDIKVTPMHPGWVQTRLGGSSAPFTPEQSADALYHGIMTNFETGKFWNAELGVVEE